MSRKKRKKERQEITKTRKSERSKSESRYRPSFFNFGHEEKQGLSDFGLSLFRVFVILWPDCVDSE